MKLKSVRNRVELCPRNEVWYKGRPDFSDNSWGKANQQLSDWIWFRVWNRVRREVWNQANET